MKTHIALVGLACNMAFLSHDVIANDININGFFSAGAGIASFDDDEEADSGALLRGYEENITFNQETVFGLQISTTINDKLSLTGQLVAQGIESDYTVDAAWAYASYEASDDLTLRIGRFRTPFYLYSDYLEVGYAYHWITPPEESYSLPFDSIDGFDALWEFPINKVDTSIQFYAGSLEDEFGGDNPVETEVRNQYGIVLSLNYDWLTLRGSAHSAESSFTNFGDVIIDSETGATIDDLANILRASGFATTADDLYVEESDFSFVQFALKVDWNNILFVTEATSFDSDAKVIGQTHRQYATLGYTMGDFMVHATYSEADDDYSGIADDIPVTDDGSTDGLIAAVDAISNSLGDKSKTRTFGIRYDFSPGAAIKLEWSEIEDDLGADGSLVRFAIDTVF